MRALNQLAKIFAFLVLLSACKTQRPTVDIGDTIYADDTTLKSMEEPGSVRSTLKVSALSFPPGALSYTRVSIRLESSETKALEIPNYTLKTEVPVKVGVKYALTVVVYKGGHPIYSNEYCQNSNRFTSRAGSNNYTVPMCLVPTEANPVIPPKEEGMMTEMPSSPSQ